TFIYLYCIHIDLDENMMFNTSKYSCDMYISTLFTSSVILLCSSVILNGWCLNSITGHIQIYVGIAAIISLFGGISLCTITFGNHIQQELFVFRVCLLSRVHCN